MATIATGCKHCGITFSGIPSRIRGREFCSLRCVGQHKRRAGGKHYPASGLKREHVVVAETALGKPLPENAVVHHVNRQIRDASNANLVICQDQAYHMLLHARQRVQDAGGNPNTDRICHRCKRVKDHAEFSMSSSRGERVRATACRPCAAAAQRRRRSSRAA